MTITDSPQKLGDEKKEKNLIGDWEDILGEEVKTKQETSPNPSLDTNLPLNSLNLLDEGFPSNESKSAPKKENSTISSNKGMVNPSNDLLSILPTKVSRNT